MTRCLTALALLLAGCAMPHVESAEPADSADSAPDGSQPNGSAPNEEPANEEEEPADPVLPPGADADGPALAVADVSAGEGDGMLRFTVSLGAAAAEQVTVSYATEDGTATAGADYRQTRGSLTFPPESNAARQVEVPILDDRVAEGAETLILRLHDARGARLAAAAATGTIADDDARAVTVQPAALNVVEGGAATYTVVLGSRPTGTVTVTPAAASPELAVAPRQLSFTAANWSSPQKVIVSAAQDADAVADEPALIEHTVRGGGYGGAAVSPLTATILEDDVSTLAVAPAYAAEHAPRMTFEVSLSLASDGAVTVEFATGAAGDTAAEGQDYAGTSGTLRFPARSTDAQVIEVTVHDDALDEDDPEHFTVTLSNPANAELAGGGATVSATGEIEDDDPKPRLSIADASLSEGAGGAMPFAVRLDPPSGRTVAVHYATADATAVAGSDYTRVSGTLTFPAGTTRRTIAVPVADDLLDEEEEHFTVTLSAAVNATMAAAPPLATGTIADDDDAVSQLSIADASLTEGAGDAMPFVVRLDPPSGRTVAVHYATADATAVAGSDYTRVGGTLNFPAGTTRRTIAVPVADDLLDEEEEHFTLTLSAAVNATVASPPRATGTITDDDGAPRLSIADATLTEGAGDAMPFVVRLDPTSARTATVHYETADATAVAGSDYTPVSGTLTFPAGTTRRTVAVPVADDPFDEQDREHFTLTLSTPVNATLASPPRATGTITDDDGAPQLSIADATLTEGAGGAMPFVVRLDPPSGRTVTVRYATADATAVAGSDYTPVSGTLTFPSGTTQQMVAVPVVDDRDAEDTETFTVTLSSPSAAALADATATGTITDDDNTPGGPDEGPDAEPDGGSAPLELDSLQVTGVASAMYPAFAADTHHYARVCNDSTRLRVTARAKRSSAQLTLLRADASDNHQSTGSLDTLVTVSRNDDIAVELSAADGTVTYVVHCVPHDFPRINILTTSERVTDGLLLINPRLDDGPVEEIFMAVVDNNGVPRFHRQRSGANFRRHPDGRYSITRGDYPVELYDERFDRIETVTVAAPLTVPNGHDFLITDEGNYLFISYPVDRRNLCAVEGQCDVGETTRMKRVFDSAIQEVTPSGDSVFLWNSWDHVKLEDCRFDKTEYAHLNSLYLKDGDIVASFRYCNQVLRIDRSSGTGAVVWQLGGTAPPRDPDTAFLAIVGDTDGQNEICGQHQATLTDADTVVLFDNGYGCRGPRKDEAPFSRAVEYDISSATQARFRRQYLLPEGQGYSHFGGGVTVLEENEENGHWLITWGFLRDATVAEDRRLAVSEVDPESGTALFEMNMDAPHSTDQVRTYRVYREPETNVPIPLNLP